MKIIKILVLFLISFSVKAQVPKSVNFDSLYSKKYEWSKSIVLSVHDGDNVKVSDTAIYKSIRIMGIDAPEVMGIITKTQPYGRDSGDSLRRLVKLSEIQIQFIQNDGYGRQVCNVRLKNGEDLAYHLIVRGLVWYKRGKGWASSLKLTELQQNLYYNAQKYAQDNKIGLWAGYWFENKDGTKKWVRPIDPSVWRKIYKLI